MPSQYDPFGPESFMADLEAEADAVEPWPDVPDMEPEPEDLMSDEELRRREAIARKEGWFV